MFKNLAPGNYQLKIAAEDHYDRTIDVTVTANTISYANVAMDRVRNTAPEVISYSPVMENETDSINCTTPIVLNFNWDMDTESDTKGFLDRPAGRREHYIRRFTVPNGIYPHSSLRGSYPIYRKTR